MFRTEDFFMKKFLTLLFALMLSSTTCFAMTFSRPVEIGRVFISQVGNNNAGWLSVENTSYYGNGIVCWGNGEDALYMHYGTYNNNDSAKFGGKNVSNTVSVNILNDWIYKIKSDGGITLYAIRFWYGPESDFRIIGRRKDGTFVKYFDTADITKKYFTANKDNISPAVYNMPRCQGDTVIIPYGTQTKKSVGEFRFKWDDKAQWFGIEQVVY